MSGFISLLCACFAQILVCILFFNINNISIIYIWFYLYVFAFNANTEHKTNLLLETNAWTILQQEQKKWQEFLLPSLNYTSICLFISRLSLSVNVANVYACVVYVCRRVCCLSPFQWKLYIFHGFVSKMRQTRRRQSGHSHSFFSVAIQEPLGF